MNKLIAIFIFTFFTLLPMKLVYPADFITGRPSDIDNKKDYFRGGMDA